MMHPSETHPGTDLTPFEQEFISRFLRESIGCDYADCPGDLAKLIFRELTRQEEFENTRRDSLGRWQAGISTEEREFTAVPRIDEYLLRLGEELSRRDPPRERKLRWPEGKPFALCLSHDVDFVSARSQTAKFLRRARRLYTAGGAKTMAVKLTVGSLYRLATDTLGPDRYGNFDRWLQLEDRFGYRSSFYFCPSDISQAHVVDPDYRYSDPVLFNGSKMTAASMVREIKNSGWDIGLHGSFYSAWLPGMLMEQRKELESVVGAPVLSCRQHYLQYDVTRTPKLQSEAGFLADSSQGFTTSIGFRAKTSLPYRCWDFGERKTLPILEIPLHVMDTALFFGTNAPANEEEACNRVIKVMDNIERVHGCLTLNWHPHNMVRPAFWNTYRVILEEAHRRGAWGCSVEQLMNWWERE
jgi:hypothetical protein